MTHYIPVTESELRISPDPIKAIHNSIASMASHRYFVDVFNEMMDMLEANLDQLIKSGGDQKMIDVLTERRAKVVQELDHLARANVLLQTQIRDYCNGK